MTSMEQIELITDIEKRCPSFKNKADFVEVVRCRECVYLEEPNYGCLVCGRTDGLSIFPAEDDFCSYGVRREE